MNGPRIAGRSVAPQAPLLRADGGVASISAADHRATRDAKWQPCCRERAYSWNAVLHIHRADRADHLAGALAGVLNEPLADPFAAEVVAVPTRGVERWVAQQLSGALGVGERSDGVCANVLFPSPRQLVDEVVGVASGFEADRDPWLPQRLVWPLLETVDAHLAEAWLIKLRAHLDLARGDRSRRLRVVAQLSTLYDRYADRKSTRLNGWLVSEDDDHWQAQLWRRLRARVGAARAGARPSGPSSR